MLEEACSPPSPASSSIFLWRDMDYGASASVPRSRPLSFVSGYSPDTTDLRQLLEDRDLPALSYSSSSNRTSSPSTSCAPSPWTARWSTSSNASATGGVAIQSMDDFALSPPALAPSPPKSDISYSFSSASSCLSSDDGDGIPENFAQVEVGLYRSSFPKEKHFGFLKTLGLKAVLVFTQEEYPDVNREFFQSEGIRFHQIGMPGNKEDSIRVPDSSLNAALEFVLDPSNYPLLLHCNKGKHRTGCVVGVLRKLQNWPIDRVLDEYIQYSTPKQRVNDKQCIIQFDVAPTWQNIVDKPKPPWILEAYAGDAR